MLALERARFRSQPFDDVQLARVQHLALLRRRLATGGVADAPALRALIRLLTKELEQTDAPVGRAGAA